MGPAGGDGQSASLAALGSRAEADQVLNLSPDRPAAFPKYASTAVALRSSIIASFGFDRLEAHRPGRRWLGANSVADFVSAPRWVPHRSLPFIEARSCGGFASKKACPLISMQKPPECGVAVARVPLHHAFKVTVDYR